MLKMDIPGMTKADIKIVVEDGVLTLSGERQRTDEVKDASYQRTERTFGRFTRAFRLPEGSNEEGIAAEVKDGVLTVTIPHSPTPPRKVHEVPITNS